VGLPVGLFLCVAIVALTTWFGNESFGEDSSQQGEAPAPMAMSPLALEKKLEDYVRVLSGKIGERHAGKPSALQAAELFVESTLGPSNIGYPVQRRTYQARGEQYANLEAVLPGRDLSDEVVVIGAHYDSAPGSPGADDNASGVAVLLALAERFAGKPQQRTIRWVAFTNEEPPWFQTEDMGSLRYARELKREGVDVAAMLALESLGYFRDEAGSQQYPPPLSKLYPDTANFVGIVGNLANRSLVKFVHGVMSASGRIPVEKGAFPELVPGVGWSDHWSFWQAGYPAVMVTDTAPYRNPHYHANSDRPDTLDYRRMAGVVEAVERVISDLANLPRERW